MLPSALLASLEGLKGFQRQAFEAVHASGVQLTSVRLNPMKPAAVTLSAAQTIQPIFAAPVPWCAGAWYLSERPSFTFDPLFHAGAYYVQEASSMFLWKVLTEHIPSPTGKKVLDLCAAPGGKSTLLAAYFKEGLVVSNEVIKSRAAILVENITKWGADQVIVTNNDPSHFQSLPHYFDVIVVDAPCSGSGLFRKDHDAIKEWSEDNVQLCSQRQQRIITDVLPALKEDGLLIYSTCSYSREEDEAILDWLVENHGLCSLNCSPEAAWNITETESERQKARGYRFYPNQVKGEGFFIAVLRKTGVAADSHYPGHALPTPTKAELGLLQSFLPLPAEYFLFKQTDHFRAFKKEWEMNLNILAKNLYIKKAGVAFGMLKGKDVIPSHELALSYLDLQSLAAVEVDKATALLYLKKKDLMVTAGKGWNLIRHCGLNLGWAKVLPNRLNNYYPGEWRILKD